MRVGIYSDLRNPPRWSTPWPTHYLRALDRIRRAEELGIAEAWLTEHHQFADGYLPQPLTFAAAIAAVTTRIRIGTGVLLAPLRAAADIAEQAAIVDILSAGRLELGLGAGYRRAEFELFDCDIAQRFQDLEARAREVRRLWETGRITPTPVQERVPIWIGAMGPRGARLAGRLGEGLLFLDPTVYETYSRALEAAGHDPATARVAGVANLIVADDPERAWSRIAPHLEYMWESYRLAALEPARAPAHALAGSDAVFADMPPVTADALRSPGPMMTRSAFDVVAPEEAVRRLRAWLADLPVSSVYFWDCIAGMDDDLVERHIELLATRVAPHVADLGIA